MQPRILNASSALVRSREERKKLQLVENRVWRHILGSQVYTPASGSVTWEIGASIVEGRDRKMKLGFRPCMFRTSNGLIIECNFWENEGGE